MRYRRRRPRAQPKAAGACVHTPPRSAVLPRPQRPDRPRHTDKSPRHRKGQATNRARGQFRTVYARILTAANNA
jgi:hypothetical protein